MRNLKRDGKKRGKKFVSLSNSNQRINQLITHITHYLLQYSWFTYPVGTPSGKSFL